jgi:ankyrin repeat/BTB/POZ domain-containing protein 2
MREIFINFSRNKFCLVFIEYLYHLNIKNFISGDILHNVTQYRACNPQSNRKSSQNWWSSHSWSAGALYSLYYYMRCAQLEHNTQMDHQKASQELVYERPYLVLPPLYEWLRVSSSHANYRKSLTIDKDDVLQAARILLPGLYCFTNYFFH